MKRLAFVLIPLALLACAAAEETPGDGQKTELALPSRVRVQTPPGMTVGQAQAVPSPSRLGQRSPEVAFGSGTYLLVWQEGFSGYGGRSEILGLRIDAAGKVLDERPLQIASGKCVHESPAVAFGGGKFLVAWSELRDGGDYDVRGVFVGADGRLSPPGGLAFAEGEGAQQEPGVVCGDKEGMLVVWQSVENGKTVMRGTRVSAGGEILDRERLLISDHSDRQFGVWTGSSYLVGYRWNYGLVGGDGKVLRPMEPSWWSKTPGAGTAVSAWGKTLLFFNTEPYPDPWGWGGNGAIIGVSVLPDGTSPERELARPLGNLQSAKALGRVANCLDAARWRNHPGWPMGMRGGLKNTHNDQWPSGRPAAAYNGRSVLVVWPRAHLVDNRRLTNRDLYLARVLPGWGTVDPVPVCIVGGPTEENSPTLEAEPTGGALLAYERVSEAGVVVEYRMLTEAEDRSPPKVAYVVPQSPTELVVAFDEPVDTETLKVDAFRIDGLKVLSAALHPDARGRQREVVLKLAEAPESGRGYTLNVSGVKDRAPAGNTAKNHVVEFTAKPGVMQRGQFIDKWTLLGALPCDVKNHPFDPAKVRPSPGDEVKTPDGKTLKWRSVPFEFLDLGQIFNEDPEQMCYANVYVYSDRERDAVLRTDTNDHNRVWLNGRLVQDDVTGVTSSRGFHDRADEAPVHLRKGWNQLLMQVTNQLTTWMMSCQLTDETGEHLRDLTFGTTAPDNGP